MTRRTFSCRNTLERLRENYDENQKTEKETNRIIIARVEYRESFTGEDGKTLTVNKERILYELSLLEPGYIQRILEQEVQAQETIPHKKTDHGSSLVVTNITPLKPTGDDDQM